MFKVSADLVISFDDDKIVASQTRDQKKYILEPSYLARLVEIAHRQSYSFPFQDKIGQDLRNKIDQSLSAGNFVTEHNASPWPGDEASRIAHNMSRILNEGNDTAQSPDDMSAQFIAMSNNVTALPPRYVPPSDSILTLPPPDLNLLKQQSLYDVLINRKTCRNFVDASLSPQDISTLLFMAFGSIHPKNREEFNNLNLNKELHQARRTSPSATGLNGCEAYVLINNVNGFEPGAYYYNQDTHCLHKTITPYNPMQISYLMQDQFWAKNIAAGIFIVTDMRFTWIKDESIRGYLATYLDAGHLSQTLLLIATAMGLSTWISGTFRDEVVNDLLALNPDHMFASFFVGFGHGDNKAIPENFLKFL